MTQEPAQEQEQQHELQHEQVWLLVHPISPFIRSWSALLIFVYLIMSFSVQELQGFIEAFNLSVGQSLLIMLGLVVAILLVAAGLYAISWWFYQFRISADDVQLHSGVIFRRRRYMRLDRLQRSEERRVGKE